MVLWGSCASSFSYVLGLVDPPTGSCRSTKGSVRRAVKAVFPPVPFPISLALASPLPWRSALRLYPSASRWLQPSPGYACWAAQQVRGGGGDLLVNIMFVLMRAHLHRPHLVQPRDVGAAPDGLGPQLLDADLEGLGPVVHVRCADALGRLPLAVLLREEGVGVPGPAAAGGGGVEGDEGQPPGGVHLLIEKLWMAGARELGHGNRQGQGHRHGQGQGHTQGQGHRHGQGQGQGHTQGQGHRHGQGQGQGHGQGLATKAGATETQGQGKGQEHKQPP